MTPYGNFLYFGLALYVVVPALAARSLPRLWRPVLLGATGAALVVQYGALVSLWPGSVVSEIWLVAGYAVFEGAVAGAFLRLRQRGAQRLAFYLAAGAALLPLLAAKWIPLFAPGTLVGFLGLSYLTFRCLDVIFGIRDGLIKTLPPVQYLAYIFFFPTLSAGPIDRYRRFQADWNRLRSREELRDDLGLAVQRIFRGFLYKFILAALIKQYWLDPAGAGHDLGSLLSYMYAYSFYLFFDFAGYSAFAVGFSYVFGIHTPENFERPFLAANIRDFWNRWHITLSWWFRDHIYMRFVLAATKGRWFRDRYRASHLGLFLSFGLMGLWHGTEVYYILYGLYHAALLTGYDVYTRRRGRLAARGGRVGGYASIFATFNLVCFGFLIFSGHLQPAPAPAVAPPTYSGTLELVSCAEIRGWAWNSARPKTPLWIDIYAGDRLLTRIEANSYRKDLLTGGKGNGVHAFTYVPPTSIDTAQPLAISARFDGTDSPLAGAPQTLACGDLVRSMAGVDGVVDQSTCPRIGGWAWDVTRPASALRVDLYADGRFLATVPADRNRADLQAAGIAGAHAFLYDLPSSLRDGRPHVLRVRFAGTAVDLQNGVTAITCFR